MHCNVNGEKAELGYKVWKGGKYHGDCAAMVLKGQHRRKKDSQGRYLMTKEEFYNGFKRLNEEAKKRNSENNGLEIMSVAYRSFLESELKTTA